MKELHTQTFKLGWSRISLSYKKRKKKKNLFRIDEYRVKFFVHDLLQNNLSKGITYKKFSKLTLIMWFYWFKTHMVEFNWAKLRYNTLSSPIKFKHLLLHWSIKHYNDNKIQYNYVFEFN